VEDVSEERVGVCFRKTGAVSRELDSYLDPATSRSDSRYWQSGTDVVAINLSSTLILPSNVSVPCLHSLLQSNTRRHQSCSVDAPLQKHGKDA
jgi:hypothetical protein